MGGCGVDASRQQGTGEILLYPTPGVRQGGVLDPTGGVRRNRPTEGVRQLAPIRRVMKRTICVVCEQK